MDDEQIERVVRRMFAAVDWRSFFAYQGDDPLVHLEQGGDRLPEGRGRGEMSMALGVRCELAAAFEAIGHDPPVEWRVYLRAPDGGPITLAEIHQSEKSAQSAVQTIRVADGEVAAGRLVPELWSWHPERGEELIALPDAEDVPEAVSGHAGWWARRKRRR